MATNAEREKATRSKKGPNAKRAKKLAQRKPKKAHRSVKAPKIGPRTKRDTMNVIAQEAEASSPEETARRARTKNKRVRATP